MCPVISWTLHSPYPPLHCPQFGLLGANEGNLPAHIIFPRTAWICSRALSCCRRPGVCVLHRGLLQLDVAQTNTAFKSRPGVSGVRNGWELAVGGNGALVEPRRASRTNSTNLVQKERVSDVFVAAVHRQRRGAAGLPKRLEPGTASGVIALPAIPKTRAGRRPALSWVIDAPSKVLDQSRGTFSGRPNSGNGYHGCLWHL